MACGSTSVSQFNSPDVVRCAVSLGGSVPTVPASGGQVPVTVGAARECSWTASSDSSWMQASPTSGQGQATVTLKVSANTVANSRTATLSVNNQQLVVPQAAAPCQFSLGNAGGTIGAAGGSLSVRLSATTGCGWTAVSRDAWVHVPTPSGSGDATIDLSVDRNTGATRSTAVTIAGLTFTVNQSADVSGSGPGPAPAPTPSPSPSPTPPSLCTYALSSYSKDFSDKGGGGSFKVITSDGCTWSVTSSADWISLASPDSGTGSMDVKYNVDHNGSGMTRIGTISVADQIYTVTQKGG